VDGDAVAHRRGAHEDRDLRRPRYVLVLPPGERVQPELVGRHRGRPGERRHLALLRRVVHRVVVVPRATALLAAVGILVHPGVVLVAAVPAEPPARLGAHFFLRRLNLGAAWPARPGWTHRMYFVKCFTAE